MRTGVLAGYADACRGLGVDPLPIVRRLGLPREVLTHSDLYVRRELTAALLHEAAEESRRPSFTMDLVDRQELTAIGALAYLPFQGSTIREGIELIAECMGYHNQGVIHRIRDLDDGVSVIETEFGLPPEPHYRQAAEMSFWRSEVFLRALFGDAHEPIEYWSPYPAPTDPSRYDVRFTTPIRWNQATTAHVVPTSTLALPPQKRPKMTTFLMEFVEQTASVSNDEKLAAEVRSVVRSLVGHSRPTLETVSAAMGTYPRDLQRQLSESDASFSDIRDAVHLDYAREALARDEPTVTVLALELGYSETSAFSRAFKKWTGSSPSAWRRSAAGGADSA